MPSALVTGASRGIGAAIARRLARDGFDVAIHYHSDEAGAEATREAVMGLGRRAATFHADLGDTIAAQALAQAVIQDFPDLTVFVNNAGIYDRTPMAAMTPEAWRRTMAVDLDGPAVLCQALAPTLSKQDDAAIVHISSIVAVRGSTHGAHYTAAKGALLGLTKAQALEMAPIRVNAVAPGYIDTDMLADDSPERRMQRAGEVPLGRIGSPDDIAGGVSFLCSPDARYVTGQTLHINGGLWMN